VQLPDADKETEGEKGERVTSARRARGNLTRKLLVSQDAKNAAAAAQTVRGRFECQLTLRRSCVQKVPKGGKDSDDCIAA
jgi:hypothetical protein